MHAGWYSAAVDNCPFCTISPDRISLENEQAIAFHDGYPVAGAIPW
jgi:diadenosine tetraphosphate (Ap4A) HIT family hydrolase